MGKGMQPFIRFIYTICLRDAFYVHGSFFGFGVVSVFQATLLCFIPPTRNILSVCV